MLKKMKDCSLTPYKVCCFVANGHAWSLCIQLPETVVEYNLASGNARVLHQDEVVGLSHLSRRRKITTYSDQSQRWLTHLSSEPGKQCSLNEVDSILNMESRNELFDLSADYICQQHHVVGVDGISVPLTVVHLCKLKRDGQNPALLICYGAYGKALEADWCSERLSLLDRGWVIAFSHVR